MLELPTTHPRLATRSIERADGAAPGGGTISYNDSKCSGKVVSCWQQGFMAHATSVSTMCPNRLRPKVGKY
jgi:hypothetical protein